RKSIDMVSESAPPEAVLHVVEAPLNETVPEPLVAAPELTVTRGAVIVKLLIDPPPSDVPNPVEFVDGDVAGATTSENVLVVGKAVVVLPLLMRLRISVPREEIVIIRPN